MTADSITAADRRFFALMAGLACATVMAGFAPSYYLRPILHVRTGAGGQPLISTFPLLVHVHAALFTVWIVIFGLQTALVATGRVAFHRRFGIAAALLVPVMLVVGVLTAIRGARDGWNPGVPFGDPVGFMFVGLVDIAVFSTLAAAGLYFRRRADLHRRLMLYATLGGLMWPAITRLRFVAPHLPLMLGVLAMLVLTPAVRDFRQRARTRWITLLLAVGILASLPLRSLVGQSDSWHAVGRWLIR